jgi:hypothetical protein
LICITTLRKLAAVAVFSVFSSFALLPANAQSTNLVSNPSFNGTTSWQLVNGAGYDSAVTRTAGSGSIQVSVSSNLSNPQINSDYIPVVPGKTYTINAYVRSGAVPVSLYSLISVYDGTKKFKANLIGSNQAPAQINTWTLSSATYTASTGDGFIKVIYGHDLKHDNGGSVWVDDCSVSDASSGQGTGGSNGVQPQLTRVNPNLLSNSNVASVTGWGLARGAFYDGSVSHTAGSGSFQISAIDTTVSQTGAQVQSALVPVTPGKTYTLSAYLLTNTFSSLAYNVIGVYNTSRVFKGNVRGSYQALSAANTWQEATVLYTAQTGDGFIRVTFGRQNGPRNDGAIWVDDLYIGEGRSFEQVPAQKKSFNGAMVRIDSLGNYEVLKNGVWTPYFPFGIYQNTNLTSYQIYSDQGFNCVMFNQGGGTSILQEAKDAKSAFNPDGMMAMIELSQYISPTMPLYNNLTDLTNMVRNVVASPLSSNILAYYWDNEAYTQYSVPQAVINTVRSLDVNASGQPLHPVSMHMGNEGMARMYNSLVNSVGTYTGNGYNRFVTIANTEQQQNPMGLGVTSATTPEALRSEVYQVLIAGGKGIAFYKDPFHVAPFGPVSSLPMWQEVPKLRSEIDQLLPVLRQPHWTSWKADASDSRILVGTRDYNGEGHLLMLNPTDQPLTFQVSLSGLSYLPTTAVNFFTGAIATSVLGSQLSVTLPAYGTAVYRLR